MTVPLISVLPITWNHDGAVNLSVLPVTWVEEQHRLQCRRLTLASAGSPGSPLALNAAEEKPSSAAL